MQRGKRPRESQKATFTTVARTNSTANVCMEMHLGPRLPKTSGSFVGQHNSGKHTHHCIALRSSRMPAPEPLSPNSCITMRNGNISRNRQKLPDNAIIVTLLPNGNPGSHTRKNVEVRVLPSICLRRAWVRMATDRKTHEYEKDTAGSSSHNPDISCHRCTWPCLKFNYQHTTPTVQD
jgi:hypothetical protein